LALDINSLNIRYTSPDVLARVLPGTVSARANAERKDTAADNSSGGQQRSRGFLQQQTAFEDRALARLAPVRPNLNPSDEAALFGSEVEAATTTPTAAGSIVGEATDANGQAVAVDIITPQTAALSTQAQANILPLTARQQYAASQLYARNNDVTFNSSAVALLAA
jgi:hypothetical protein